MAGGCLFPSFSASSTHSRRHGLEDLQLQVLPHDLSLDARHHWRRARVRHLVQERLQRDAVRE